MALLVEGDYAEDAVAVVIGASREEELVVCTVGAAVVGELDAPEAVDFAGVAASIAERAKESTRTRVKGVNAAARNIVGDEKCVAHRAEVSRSDSDAPRRMQGTMGSKVTDEHACGSKGIDEATLGLVQGGVDDPDGLRAVVGSGDLDSVGSEVAGNAGIVEGARTQILKLEGTVKYINAAVRTTIGSEKEVLSVVAAESKSSVNGAEFRAVSADGGMADSSFRGSDDGTPATDGAVQGGENEEGFAGDLA